MAAPEPNLFVVGAAKCGTTALHEYLATHSDVWMTSLKETHHFTEDVIRPRPLNATQYAALFRGSERWQYRGESSPSYLWDSSSARQIYDASPHAKIIALLRNPVERAYSHYLMDVHNGVQRKEFWDALVEDEEVSTRTWGGRSHLYVDLGMYAQQLRRYYELFDANQVLVVETRDLRKHRYETLRSIADFLSIEARYDAAVVEPHNTYRVARYPRLHRVATHAAIRAAGRAFAPRALRDRVRDTLEDRSITKPVMDPAAEEYLNQRFASDLAVLPDLVGRSLPSLQLSST